VNNLNKSLTGVVHIAFPDETPLRAIFNATLERVIGGEIEYTYRVIATDYTNYSVMWSCTDLPDNRSVEEGVVISRGTALSASSYAKIDAILLDIGLVREDFRLVEHTVEA
jgi:hypothetical protein